MMAAVSSLLLRLLQAGSGVGVFGGASSGGPFGRSVHLLLLCERWVGSSIPSLGCFSGLPEALAALDGSFGV